MTPYIIAYDLKGDDPDYDSVYDKIEEITSYSKRVQESVFICKSSKEAKELRDDFKTVVKSDDEILVIEVIRHWAARNLRITKEEFNKIYE
jgi:CRISPR-associated endonuclease Cas2